MNRWVVGVVLALGLGWVFWAGYQDTHDGRIQAERIAVLEAQNDRLEQFIDRLGPIVADAGVEVPSSDDVATGAPAPVRVTGDQGPQGPRGPQGLPGEPGAGVDGEDGADGSDGQDGTDAVARDGQDGLDGQDGTDGTPGPAGPPGEPGPQGEPGPGGADGAPGPVGPQGAVGPMPAGIVIPDGQGGTCTATDVDLDGVYACP